MMLSSFDQIVLQNFSRQYPKRFEKFMVFAIWLLPLILLFNLFDGEPEIFKWLTEDWMTGLIRGLEKIQEDPMILFNIVSFLLSFLPPIYMYRAYYHERLFMTQVGIRYQSPLPLFLQWIKPDWLIKWSQIKSAYLKQKAIKLGGGPLAMTLVIETASQRREINPCAWLDPNAPEDSHPSSYWQMFTPEQTKHVLPFCPVMAYFSKMNIPIQKEKVEAILQPQATEFALESNPHSLAAMILLFSFMGYGLLDFMINQETYAQRALYELYLGGGVFIALIVMGWLILAKLPKPESMMIALLVGGAFGAALYPGLLRINQFTDTTGLQTYQYVLQADYGLKPLKDQTLPTLYFKRDLDYWSHFELASLHEIQLRKGQLAFYQINMAPIYKEMRQYFKKAR